MTLVLLQERFTGNMLVVIAAGHGSANREQSLLRSF